MSFYLIFLIYLLIGMAILDKISLKKHKYKICIFWLVANIGLLTGLRASNIGNDTQTYYNFFNTIDVNNWEQAFNIYFEKGYVLLNLIVKMFCNNGQAIILITSFIETFLFMRFILLYSKNKYVSVWLYFTMLSLMDSMNIIRHFLAVGIILFGIKYVIKRNFKKYIFIVILATIFHETAIISLILYFIYDIKFKFKNIAIMSFLGMISFFILERIINVILIYFPNYSSYITRIGTNNLASKINFLINLILVIWGGFILKRYKISMSNFEKYVFLTMIMATILSFVSIKMNILGRLNIFFDIYILIYIPLMLNFIKNKKEKIFMCYVITNLTLMHFIIILYFRADWYGVIPYKLFGG